jgi:hypothetical protein
MLVFQQEKRRARLTSAIGCFERGLWLLDRFLDTEAAHKLPVGEDQRWKFLILVAGRKK